MLILVNYWWICWKHPEAPKHGLCWVNDSDLPSTICASHSCTTLHYPRPLGCSVCVHAGVASARAWNSSFLRVWRVSQTNFSWVVLHSFSSSWASASEWPKTHDNTKRSHSGSHIASKRLTPSCHSVSLSRFRAQTRTRGHFHCGWFLQIEPDISRSTKDGYFDLRALGIEPEAKDFGCPRLANSRP